LTYNLFVVNDTVLGTGSDGTIYVYDQSTNLVCSYSIPSTDAFVGGDSYSLSPVASIYIDPTKTNANIVATISSSSSNPSSLYIVTLVTNQNYYVQLQLNVSASTIASSLNAKIYISGGVQTINITNGVALTTSTDWIPITANSKTYIAISNAYASTGTSSTLKLYVVGCTAGPNFMGACVLYPLTITLNT